MGSVSCIWCCSLRRQRILIAPLNSTYSRIHINQQRQSNPMQFNPIRQHNKISTLDRKGHTAPSTDTYHRHPEAVLTISSQMPGSPFLRYTGMPLHSSLVGSKIPLRNLARSAVAP